jgi:hypothetical protein
VTRKALGILVACAICLFCGQVLADPVRDDAADTSERSDPALRAFGSSIATNGQRAFAATPYRAVRAETTTGERIGFWAHGEGFANGRGASVYGTFRMLGDGDGFDLSRLGVGVSAPLVGLALQF